MEQTALTVELVAAAVAIISSVIAELFDGWEKFGHKRKVMLGVNFAVPILTWVLICLAGVPLPVQVDCSQAGLVAAVFVGVVAATGNQVAYRVVVRPMVSKSIYRVRHDGS